MTTEDQDLERIIRDVLAANGIDDAQLLKDLVGIAKSERRATPGEIPTPDRLRGWLQTWIDTTARPCDCRAEIQELLTTAGQPGEIPTPETVIVKHRSGCAAWTTGHPQRWQEGDEQQCDCGAADFVKAETRTVPPETKTSLDRGWFRRQAERVKRDVAELPEWLRSKPTPETKE